MGNITLVPNYMVEALRDPDKGCVLYVGAGLGRHAAEAYVRKVKGYEEEAGPNCRSE